MSNSNEWTFVRYNKNHRLKLQRFTGPCYVNELPIDIIKIILSFLSSRDVVAFCMSAKRYIVRSEQNEDEYMLLEFLTNDCRIEIENIWNQELLPDAEAKARSKDKIYKSSVCNGREASSEKEFKCSIFPWKYHNVKVTFVYNPWDIHLWAWYLNSKKMGYTFG